MKHVNTAKSVAISDPFIYLSYFAGVSSGSFDSNEAKAAAPYALGSSKSLKIKIDTLYDQRCDAIKYKLQKVDFVCTTADLWSTKHRTYIGTTIHWLDPNTLCRKSSSLSCNRFRSPHTNDRIAEQLHDINSKYEIVPKIVATVTDNASNFAKAFKVFGITSNSILREIDETAFEFDDFFDMVWRKSKALDENEGDENETEFIHNDHEFLPRQMRCASHTLNLTGSKDSTLALKNSAFKKMHTAVFSKLNFLWRKANRPKSSELIEQFLKCALKRPCPTRWNSVYDCVDQIVEMDRELLNKLMTALQVTPFTVNEYIFLEEYVKVMQPIALALDHLQQSDCYYAILLPTMHTVRSNLNKLKEGKLNYASKLLHEIEKGVNTRFDYCFDLDNEKCQFALTATCIHPFFKLRWLSGKFKSQDVIRRIQELIIAAAKDLLQSSVTNATQTNRNANCSSNVGEFLFRLDSSPLFKKKLCPFGRASQQ